MSRSLILLAAAAIACASTPDAQVPPLPGCYRFQAGEAVDTYRLPAGVRLTDRPLEGWPAIARRGDVKVAITLTGDGEADHPFGYWLEEPGDSVEIGYPAGGGIVLDLAVVDNGLEGRARAVGDVMQYGREPGPRSLPVRLEPASCR